MNYPTKRNNKIIFKLSQIKIICKLKKNSNKKKKMNLNKLRNSANLMNNKILRILNNKIALI